MNMEFLMPRSAEELKQQMVNMFYVLFKDTPTEDLLMNWGGNGFYRKKDKSSYIPIEVDGRIEIQKLDNKNIIDGKTKYYIKNNQWFDENNELVALGNFDFLKKVMYELLEKDTESI